MHCELTFCVNVVATVLPAINEKHIYWSLRSCYYRILIRHFSWNNPRVRVFYVTIYLCM